MATPSTPSDKVVRRRRKAPPRRVPSLVEQRERKPVIFGWGADLNHREREALKERIALYAGIALALVLAVLLGWGWYHDNVAVPNQIKAENNQQIAQVGQNIIRMGYFKHVQSFRNQQLNTQLSQIQQQLTSLETDTKNAKKNSAQISQLQAQQSAIQQQLGSLADTTLTTLINDAVITQQSGAAGVPLTPKVRAAALTNIMQQAGGKRQLALFENQTYQQTGLSPSELQGLVFADYLRSKVSARLAKSVSHVQTEVRASHILVSTKKKALAEQLYHQALNGANFAALAKKYSTDPGSAKKGGDLGYFPHGQMVAAFDKAAFSMKVGGIRLVQSNYGWHIIKNTGRKQVTLTPTQYQQAQQNAFSQWLATQQAKLHVQRFISVNNLPTPVATGTAIAGVSGAVPGQVPSGSGQLPPNSGQVPAQVPQQPAVPPAVNPAKGSKAKGSTSKP